MKWFPQLAFEYDPTVEREPSWTMLIDEARPRSTTIATELGAGRGGDPRR